MICGVTSFKNYNRQHDPLTVRVVRGFDDHDHGETLEREGILIKEERTVRKVIQIMVCRQIRTKRGLALAEALLVVTITTLVLLAAFNAAFTAERAAAQTTQSLDAENLAASALAEVKSAPHTFTLPFEDQTLFTTRSAEYTLVRRLEPTPGVPHCAKATITVTWKQGRLDQKRVRETLVPVGGASSVGGGP
jgi:hypothetical protein